MKALVVYDSVFGCTQKIAQAMGEAIDAQVLRTTELKPSHFDGIELLIVGSPTHGCWFTLAIWRLLKVLPSLKQVNVAAFDTRSELWPKFFCRASRSIARRLVMKGGRLLARPEGFFVHGTHGPVREGEPERAAEWARFMIQHYHEKQIE